MTVRNYQDMIAWKKAFELALEVYRVTSDFPSEEKCAITSQRRRAGISIASNIAEGDGRQSKAEFRHYLSIALGSLRELETQSLISGALHYVKPAELDKLINMSAEAGRLINGLSKSLRKV